MPRRRLDRPLVSRDIILIKDAKKIQELMAMGFNLAQSLALYELPLVDTVYALVMPDGELRYIGQSSDLYHRLGVWRHLRVPFWQVYYVICSNVAEAIALESKLIAAYKPRGNTIGL